METSYEMKSKIEEKYFTQFAQTQPGIIKYEFTPTTCSYDVKMNSGGTMMIAEIKIRKDRTMQDFEQYGPFLEHVKIAGLQKFRDEVRLNNIFNLQMIYVNFCKDGIQLYNLADKEAYTYKYRLLPKNNEDLTIKVQKLVTELYNPFQTIKY